MHPILFRIPLPTFKLPVLWVLLAVAAIAALWALYTAARKDRKEAIVPGGVAVIAAVAAFIFRAAKPELGPVPIYSYGVMLGASLVVGWYLTLALAERDGLPKEVMANNYVITALAAVVGSRILYILTNLHEFHSIEDMLAFRKGGLVAYGGFLGGYLGSLIYLRQHKIPLMPWADVAVPSLASGLLITRIGCYLFGCDFGQPLKETAPAWLKKLGTFPRWAEGTLDGGSGSPAWVQHVKERGLSISSDHSMPVHPTQIYESLVGLSLLALLLWARRHQKFRGQIFFLFTFAYGVCRFGLEILRDDAERGSIPPALPEHVLIPLCFALFAVGYYVGFSNWIKNLSVRRATQVIAFVPAVALFFMLRPETFATASTIQLSTSQFIALSSGLAVSFAFLVFQKAADMHPERAMALGIPEPKPAKPAADQPDEPVVEDEDDGEEARKVVKKVKKKKAKKKVEEAPKKASDDEGEEPVAKKKSDEGEEEKPVAKKKSDDDGEEEKPVAKKKSDEGEEEKPVAKKKSDDEGEEEKPVAKKKSDDEGDD